MCDNDGFLYVGCLMVGFAIGLVVAILLYGSSLTLSQEVGDDICQQLTKNETAIAKDFYDEDEDLYKLKCILPSFDSTHNIIIEKGGSKE